MSLEGKESREIWIVDTYQHIPELKSGWTHPELKRHSETFFVVPGSGGHILGKDCFLTFGEAHEQCLQNVEKSIDDTRRELNRLEKAYSKLLNPVFWKPHFEE